MKPIVDGLEAEYQGRLQVIRIDMQSAAGRSLAPEFGAISTPTFIFLDANGEVAWTQVGFLSREKIQDSLEE